MSSIWCTIFTLPLCEWKPPDQRNRPIIFFLLRKLFTSGLSSLSPQNPPPFFSPLSFIWLTWPLWLWIKIPRSLRFCLNFLQKYTARRVFLQFHLRSNRMEPLTSNSVEKFCRVAHARRVCGQRPWRSSRLSRLSLGPLTGDFCVFWDPPPDPSSPAGCRG